MSAGHPAADTPSHNRSWAAWVAVLLDVLAAILAFPIAVIVGLSALGNAMAAPSCYTTANPSWSLLTLLPVVMTLLAMGLLIWTRRKKTIVIGVLFSLLPLAFSVYLIIVQLPNMVTWTPRICG